MNVCIYHNNCADGFTAAWAVWRKAKHEQELDQWIFYGATHGKPLEIDVTGKNVYFVDFSYKRPVIEQLLEKAAHITILDHHKSAIEDLETLEHPKLTKVFDLNRSGAGITWDYFWNGEDPFYRNDPEWNEEVIEARKARGWTRPVLVDYVEDRDLWRFKHPHSREFSATLFSFEYNFELWDLIAEHLEDGPDYFEKFVVAGEAIERKHQKDIEELRSVTERKIVFDEYTNIPCANFPYTMSSDAANQMAKGHPFAACYYINKDGKRVWSLRSDENGVDVSAIAKKFGGGGHFHAAGMQTDDDDMCVVCSTATWRKKS